MFQLAYVSNKYICEDICGDGYLNTLACDLPLGVANDGCADDCTVEPSFACANTASSATINGVSYVTSASKCHYTGTVTISVAEARQSIFSNTLTLGFFVKPYLLGMPTNADPQAYLQSIFELSPLNTIAAYTISVDPVLETVTFDISHTADINSVVATFLVKFTVLATDPMFQSLPDQSLTVSIS